MSFINWLCVGLILTLIILLIWMFIKQRSLKNYIQGLHETLAASVPYIDEHLKTLKDTYPDLEAHVKDIRRGNKPHVIYDQDRSLLIYKIVPEHYIKVNTLHILQDYRGEGRGERLLARLIIEQTIHELPITITVPVNNRIFIRWLLKKGFTIQTILKDKYVLGTDMVLLINKNTTRSTTDDI